MRAAATDRRTTAPAEGVVTTALTRTFATRQGVRTALDAVDLRLHTGGVHGLLGPNGAGKTTLCKILSTVLLPTSGTARVLGHDVVADAGEVRHLVGIVFGGDRGLYGRLTARDNLAFWCAMHGLRRRAARARVDALLDRLGLGARADDRVETMSRGMRQRLHLARGLVADPPVLLLDEPTVGMDPLAAHEFRGLVEELRREGRTVLLTTHDMAEADALCDTLTFVDGGGVVVTGTAAEVRAAVTARRRVTVHDVGPGTREELVRLLRDLRDVVVGEVDGRTRSVEVGVPADGLAAVVAALVDAGRTSFSATPPTVHDVYVGLLDRRVGDRPRGLDVG